MSATLAPVSGVPPSGRLCQPSEHGDLAARPLVHQLAQALSRQATLSTVLHGPDGPSVLYVHRGAPAKVRTARVLAPLDETLLDMGYLDAATLIETYEAACDQRMLHGQALVTRGLIDRPTLELALRRQLERKLGGLFELPPGTRYERYDGVNLLDEYGGRDLVAVDPMAIVLTGVHKLSREPRVLHALSAIDDASLELSDRSDLHGLVGRLERPVLARLAQRPATMRELVATGVASAHVVQIAVYALLVTGKLRVRAPEEDDDETPTLIRIVDDSPPSQPKLSSGVRSIPIMPALPAGAPLGEGEIHERARAIAAEDFFAVLGVPRDAADEQIRAAYFFLTKRWHPDRLAPELASLRPLGTRVFSRIIDAYAVLGDRARRVEYLRELSALPDERGEAPIPRSAGRPHNPARQPRATTPRALPVASLELRRRTPRRMPRRTQPTPRERGRLFEGDQRRAPSANERESVALSMDATAELQQAELALARGEPAIAERHARAALELDPTRPEALALRAWAQALRLGPPPERGDAETRATHYQRQLRVLDALVRKEPHFERARYFRAMLLKLSGRTDEAMADFRAVVRENPRNLDAVRELRIHEMRRRQGSRAAVR